MAQSAHRPGPPLGVLAAGGAVTLVLIAAAVRPPWQFGAHGLYARYPVDPRLAGSPAPVPSAPPIRPTTSAPSLHLGPVLGVVLGVVLGLLVLALVLLAVRWWRRRVRPVGEPELQPGGASLATVEPDLPTLRRGAVAADERLLAIGDPTDAIVAAWLALEDAATASGVPRPAASTPTEFTAAVLEGTGAPAEPVRTLLGLYLRARFGARGADPDDLDVARSCVRVLADHWDTYAVDPSGPSR